MATVGIDRDEAVLLRALFEQTQARHARAPLKILVEPVDPIYFRAKGAKTSGVLKEVARALHIELPRSARTEHRDAYIVILAEFLSELSARTGGSGQRKE